MSSSLTEDKIWKNYIFPGFLFGERGGGGGLNV